MNVESVALRADILARYHSVHAFCKAHPELKRTTVYLVLSGKYPGHVIRQEARILEVLDGSPPGGSSRAAVPVERMTEVLQACKCAHCRRLDRRGCRGCRNQTAREIAALKEVLS